MTKFQRIYWSEKFDWQNYSKIYNKYAKSKDNYYLQSSNCLLKNIELNKSSKVIDMGCGTGAMTRELLRKYPCINILAIDLSKEMIECYKKNFYNEIKSGQIKTICGNAEKINEYAVEQYDAVFISSALWDLKIETLFRSIAKIINKEGCIIFNLPALVVGKERGFIFFIEHFFRKALNSDMIYRRIDINYLSRLLGKNNLQIAKTKEYSFKMPKNNVVKFFDLLRYRYPFILFPENMPYKKKLRKCTEIFNESLKYLPKEGIKEEGIIFIVNMR